MLLHFHIFFFMLKNLPLFSRFFHFFRECFGESWKNSGILFTFQHYTGEPKFTIFFFFLDILYVKIQIFENYFLKEIFYFIFYLFFRMIKNWRDTWWSIPKKRSLNVPFLLFVAKDSDWNKTWKSTKKIVNTEKAAAKMKNRRKTRKN